jgi:hypothetical protein
VETKAAKVKKAEDFVETTVKVNNDIAPALEFEAIIAGEGSEG